MKKCSKCKKFLPFESFGKNKAQSDGYQNNCNDCYKILSKEHRERSKYSMKTLIRRMYNNQKFNSKRRGDKPPSYTKREFIHWLYDNGFVELYRKYKNSGYNKKLLPSCDRLDDYKSYTLDNLRLTNWRKNYMTAHRDVTNGINNKKSKAVDKFSIDGKYIETYWSISEAARANNLFNSAIVRCLKGYNKTSGGFLWRYTDVEPKKRPELLGIELKEREKVQD